MSKNTAVRDAEVARVAQLVRQWQRGRYTWRTVIRLMGYPEAVHVAIATEVSRAMDWPDVMNLVGRVLYPDLYPRISPPGG